MKKQFDSTYGAGSLLALVEKWSQSPALVRGFEVPTLAILLRLLLASEQGLELDMGGLADIFDLPPSVASRLAKIICDSGLITMVEIFHGKVHLELTESGFEVVNALINDAVVALRAATLN
jgi:DNA-binding MarR family transcriptional regulator